MKGLFRTVKKIIKLITIWIVIIMTCISFYRSLLPQTIFTDKDRQQTTSQLSVLRKMKVTDQIWGSFQERKRFEKETADFYRNFTHKNMTNEEYVKFSNNVDRITKSGKKMKRAFVPFSQFRYPLDVNMSNLVKAYKANKGNIEQKSINKYPYSFINFPKRECGNSRQNETFLLYLIKSAPANFGRRKAIRETWGSEDISAEYKVMRVFLLGLPKHSGNNLDIDAEVKLYGDILQMSFYDSYFNNTLKAIGGLRWAVNHCLNTKFIIFGDDDFYFATETILDYLNSMDKQKTKTFFMGKLGQRSVERYDSGKWTTSASEYPYDKYPPFLLAGAMFMSMQFAVDFDIAVQFTKLFRFDDVFFGIVAYKLGIIPQHNEFIISGKMPPLYDKNQFRRVLASHKLGDPVELRKVWIIHRKIMKMYKKN